MWGVLTIALLLQWGLGRSIETLIGEWGVRFVWIAMAVLTIAWLAIAYRSPAGVMDDVFAWRGVSARWIGVSVLGGVGFSVLARLVFASTGPIPSDTVVISTTVGPLLEELLYRGFLWCVVSQVVAAQDRDWGATAIVAMACATLFALAHANPTLGYFGFRFLGGVLAGVLRHFSASTVPPAMAHLCFNITVLSR